MAYFYNNYNNNSSNNNNNIYCNNDRKQMHNSDDGSHSLATTTTTTTIVTTGIAMANDNNNNNNNKKKKKNADCGSSNFSIIDSDSSTGDGFYVGRSREHLHALLTVPLKTNIPRQTVNARERGRTRSVNGAFNSLRTLIPTAPYNRKLSKIEILRLTTSYICHLEACVSTGNVDRPCSVHQQQLNHSPPPKDARSAICTFCAAASTNTKSCQQ